MAEKKKAVTTKDLLSKPLRGIHSPKDSSGSRKSDGRGA